MTGTEGKAAPDTAPPYSKLDQDSLAMHAAGRPGKIEIVASKPLTTQRDLALAYSPGVAAPCKEIARDPQTAYDYTAKGNLVAVISNGTAVLGLGDLGASASKPVMEGKAVLFKRFADVDSIDLEIDTRDVDAFVDAVRYLGPSFGGINLEDIKAPECFIIEERLRELMDIPVFHDDQHGTAIIATAGLINALHLTDRDIGDVRVVVNGAGAAAIACIELIEHMGAKPENVIMCDSKGVVYLGRTQGMNQWKSRHAADTDARTLADAMKGADVFLGLSVKGAVTPDMIASMAKNPIVFAMANPDPEITPEDAAQVRTDVIMATGRSDYPNQVNNVLGFPYIFRGALDVRASDINIEMKRAAAEAIAGLAREDTPDEVAAAYAGKHLRYGPDYIIPVPFDPRLISAVPLAVAQAAMRTGVARKPIVDPDAYRAQLSGRLNPITERMHFLFKQVRHNPQRVVFAEGEEETAIRAATAYRNQGYGTPILVGREQQIRDSAEAMGLTDFEGIHIENAALSDKSGAYIDFVYKRLQRQGILHRDARRMVNQHRNVFAACMVANGDADAVVTGLTRNFHTSFQEIRTAIDPAPDQRAFGFTLILSGTRTLLLADTLVHDLPTAEEMADIAALAAAEARNIGQEPRVALLSCSNFGNPLTPWTDRQREAMRILESRKPDFEFDGEMSVEVALDDKMRELYPFCRLSGPANVLIMPGLNSAMIASKFIRIMGGGTVIGPLLSGLDQSVQIVPMDASVSDMVQVAAIAAYEAIAARNGGSPVATAMDG